LAGLAAMIGIWVGLRMAPRLGLSRDPYRYFLRAALWLTSFVLLFSFSSSRLALYPSVALLCISLAFLAKKTGVKLLLWLISPYLMYRLFFNEGFFLFARIVPEGAMTTGLGFSLFWHVLLVLFFSLWSYPFLLGFAGLYSGASGDLLWLRAFKQRTGIVLAGLGFFVCALWLSTKPSHTDLWKQDIRVNGEYDLKSGKGRLYVRSSDYLDETSVKAGSLDTVLTGWSREFRIPGADSLGEPWINTARRVETTKVDSSTRFDILTTITLKHRPLSITLTYSGSKHQLRGASSGLAATTTPRTISLRWSTFPGTIILAPVQFTVVGADSVTESIEATFIESPIPLRIEKQVSAVIARTVIRSSTTVKAANSD
ncbi:MAG: Zn-dependent exopeptidase M28, partial [Bacteroidetes bacterium]|nr:Zn-dependent exopeptidase M28 [Bacteroidota bacterium]